jgi:hypothetical protein
MSIYGGISKYEISRRNKSVKTEGRHVVAWLRGRNRDRLEIGSGDTSGMIKCSMIRSWLWLQQAYKFTSELYTYNGLI